jgi:hypothetical protein
MFEMDSDYIEYPKTTSWASVVRLWHSRLPLTLVTMRVERGPVYGDHVLLSVDDHARDYDDTYAPASSFPDLRSWVLARLLEHL